MSIPLNKYSGRLDELSDADNKRDVNAIREYIIAEENACSAVANIPSIVRQVLINIWEKPRTRFHQNEVRESKKIGAVPIKFNSKLLLIPWSGEAFKSFKATRDVSGLELEHVMPLSAMWEKLKELHKECSNGKEWVTNAAGHLINNYMLAVVTKEQHQAINSVGLKSTGTEGDPFGRYRMAKKRMDEKGDGVAFDLDAFVMPGMAAPDFQQQLEALQEEAIYKD